ncbi:hypothetical protein GGX14DRAFT_581605 [Mycena pura]|uniref:Uncharacterized protein n=1 Tax=Mycena pura TaxID=153505 RepID=A0AAD7E5F3_9AGAR|nr:hypothetical protein GGX14DRAFT_581605 [Mycena pura]
MSQARVLLNNADVFSHPEVKSAREGFGVELFGAMSLPKTIIEIGLSRFLLAMFDQNIKNVDDLWQRIDFTVPQRQRSRLMYILVKLFEVRLRQYLLGVGHPTTAIGFGVTESDVNTSCDAKLLRAKLLLVAVSDSEMLPPDRFWSIEFTFSGKPPTMMELAAPDLADQQPDFLKLHTCCGKIRPP